MPSLLGLRDLTLPDVEHLLTQANVMQEVLQRQIPKVPTLRGRRVAMLFFESSTRTRLSFEIAAKSMGADVLNFSPSGSSLSKGETLLDTAMTIKAMGADCLVVRAQAVGLPAFLSKEVGLPVINAGDGSNEHPTQALLDYLVLTQHWQNNIAGRHIVIIGDVARSRVARSHLWLAEKLGVKITIIAPKTFIEPGFTTCFPVEVVHEPGNSLQTADAVILLRIQSERHSTGGPYYPNDYDYYLRYGMNLERLKVLAPQAVVLHPGPVNRGVEITPDLLYSEKSFIQAQVSAGVAMRMAVLYWVLGGQHAN